MWNADRVAGCSRSLARVAQRTLLPLPYAPRRKPVPVISSPAVTPTLTFIIGCTGSGKGSLGRELARRTDGEIISIDSMKVYRRMDIGTAKPSIGVRKLIPHHLIDIVEPSEEFSVAEYVKHAERAITDIQARRRPVFVVGGTPLYIKALSEGLFEGPGADPTLRARLIATAEREGRDALYNQLRRVDPTAAERIHPNDLRRIVRALEVFELTGHPISALQEQWDRDRSKYECVFIGLRREREDQAHRINERVRRMIAEGLVDEVRSLLAEARPLSTAARQALGYAEFIQHLEGRCTLAEAVEMIKINTRQFAKAQRTWFKRFAGVEWIDLSPDADAADVADTLIARRGSLWSP
jgi:tRNA dimethylallyltransferase